MPRILTEQQEANVIASSTRPIFLIAHQFSGAWEYAIASGSANEITMDGTVYVRGEVSLDEIQDARSAAFSFFPTADRVQQCAGGQWRDGLCRIYMIPGKVGSTQDTFSLDDAVLLLDGVLRQCGVSRGKVTARATHAHDNRLTPRATWDRLSAHVPPSGYTLTWEGSSLTLESPEQRRVRSASQTRSPATGLRGQLTAQEMRDSSLSAQPLSVTVTGTDAPIELVYGRVNIGGKIIAVGMSGSNLVIAVGWCAGEIDSVEQAFIGGEVPPGAITQTHYVGRHTQGVDPTLAAAIPAFNANFVLTTDAGQLGAAYTVFKIPPGVLSGAPTFTATVLGRRVYDPRKLNANYPSYAYIFRGPDGTTSVPNLSPVSPTATATASGEASIQRNALMATPGPYNAFSVASTATLGGVGSFAVEALIEFPADGSTTDHHDIGRGGNSWILRIASKQLRLFLTSDGSGTSWDIKVNQLAYNFAGYFGVAHIAFVRHGQSNTYYVLVNGQNVYSFVDSRILRNDLGLTIGASEANRNPVFRVLSFRLYRSSVGGFSSSGFTGLGYPFPTSCAYSANTALCLADLTLDPVVGLNSDIHNVEACADFNDALLSDGTTPRSRISIALSEPRKTIDYMDYLAEHAEVFWFNQSRGIYFRPNSIAHRHDPSGQRLNVDENFSDPGSWSPGTGWSITGGQAVANVAPGSGWLTQATNKVLPGDVVAMRVDVSDYSAGNITPLLYGGGVQYKEAGFTINNNGIYVSLIEIPRNAANITHIVLAPNNATLKVDSLRVQRLYWLETHYVEDSLDIQAADQLDSPNSVSVRYTQPSGAANWGEAVTDPVRTLEVETGQRGEINTVLSLRGVYSSAEASNKALSKLRRFDNSVQYTYLSTDHGIRFRRGDIIELRPAGVPELFSTLLRVDTARVIEPGRVLVSGSRYSPDQYPDEVPQPSVTGNVPVGAIVFTSASEAPSGWDFYNAANDRLILGAGGSYSVNETGGSATHAGISGQTSSDSMHPSGVPTDTFLTSYDYTTSGSHIGYGRSSANTDTTHSHNYNTGTLTPNLLRRKQRMIIKTGSAAPYFPAGAQVLGAAGILAPDIQRLTAAAGRLLEAAASNSNAGVSSIYVQGVVDSGGVNHVHWQFTSFSDRATQIDYGPFPQGYTQRAQGPHVHSLLSTALQRNPKRKRVALYGGESSFLVYPGCIVLWAGSLGSLPAGWYLCDGNNNTIDLRDYFIEIANEGNEGTAEGNNTLSYSSSTTHYGHSHRGIPVSPSGNTRWTSVHASEASHNHSFSKTVSWMPPYYALAAIMYAPI